MTTAKEYWKQAIAAALNGLASQGGSQFAQITTNEVVTERPPASEMGDVAFPMFPFARILKLAPAIIAQRVASEVTRQRTDSLKGEASAAGPYLNVKLDVAGVAGETLDLIAREGRSYGTSDLLKGRKVMVEFSSPNTNKPLHLGHLRNDAIGESVSRVLAANGAQVMKVNLVNDRGIHICKSMLAYTKFGEGRTPQSEGVKSDHFVGDYYVRFANWAKQDPAAEEGARELLRKWESGDAEVVRLWKQMNGWAIGGIEVTYRRTGISFDRVYLESETYRLGRDEILGGLEKGVFYKDPDGSIWVDLEDAGLDKKVLLRSDGTSLYVTQDIGTVIARHRDYPFDRLIYVVGSEQQYHFKVLFTILKRLGMPWADSLFHLSYGMVNLPEGKMKSREGTVVDADDLLDELSAMAGEEIRAKGREEEVGDVAATSEAIALGALNYYLLQVSPGKDMVFNPKESLSFNGNTGPYLQYMGTRISSMLRKFDERRAEFENARVRAELIQRGDEWELVKLLGQYPEIVERAAQELAPNVVAVYLYELSQTFSRYYHDNPVLHNDDRDLVATRVALSRSVLQVLRNAFDLVCVPFLEKM